MNLFLNIFGWIKASKCKRLIKRVQCRVKLLKNKRESIIRHLQEDVVQLLRNGEDQRAFIRVDQLAKDQNIVAAYDLLDHFCEFILINVPYIRQHKDCPNDINEAASSLLYASARCGDLPELIGLRKLFGQRYGKPFEITAVELLPGNLVNRQVIEKLCVKSISHEVKFRLMKQIAKDNGLEHGTPETESQNKVSDLSIQIYDPEWAKKVTSIVACHSPNQIDITAKVEKPKELDHLYEPEMILHRFSSQSCPAFSSSSRLSSASLQHKIESITEPAASEYSFQLSERNISYLDDVEELEVQPTTQENSKDKDQRLFMFTSTFSPPVEVNISGLSDLYEDVDQCKPSDRRTSSQRTPKRRKTTRKRSRRRSMYVENEMCNASTSSSLSVNDVDSERYYYKEMNRRSHHRRKQQKSMSVEERRFSSYTDNGKRHPFTPDLSYEQRKPEGLHCEEIRQKCSSHRRIGHGSTCNFNCDTKDNCCLEHPCYFVTSEEKDDGESPALSRWASQIRKMGTRRLHKTERKKQAAPVYNHVESCESSSGSGPYGAKKRSEMAQSSQVHSPYMRIMTMPPERPKDKARDRIVKFASCEFPQTDHNNSNGSSSLSSCRHIHPKLPDYDELTSRFTALKEEYLRNSRSDLSNG